MNIKRRRTFTILLYYTILTILAIIFILPFIWLVSSSLQEDSDIFRHNVPTSWKAFFPPNPTVNSYKRLLSDARVPFLRAITNSLVVSLTTAFLGVVINAMAGYAFARYEFKGKNILFGFMLLSFFVPTELIVIPLYLVCKSLRLTNTYAGLVLPMLGNGIVILMFKQFFEELRKHGIRAEFLSEGTIDYRVRDAETRYIPYIVVIGKKEIESGNVTVRYKGNLVVMNREEFIKKVLEEIKNREVV